MVAKELMMALLREAVDGTFVANIDESLLDDNTLCELFELAQSQDLAHIVAYSLEKRGALPKNEVGDRFSRLMMLAAYRYEGQAYEMSRVSSTYERQGIDHALLKGAVICHKYPEPWMRTMSDIDVLVKEDELERAVSVLCRELGYTERERGAHDVSLFSSGGVHIELHFCLMDEQSIGVLGDESAKLMRQAWQTASLCENSAHSYELSDEVFYTYHLAHMAKHVLGGGCGVKPFLDALVLSSSQAPLVVGDRIKAFEMGVLRLCDVWFGDGAHDDNTIALENYVLSGGVYGNEEQRAAAGQSAKGGKLAYVLGRIFLPYDELKYRYPVLKKHKWLTPIFEVVRWISIPFKKGISETGRELGAIGGVSRDSADRLSAMFSELGLK